jgi:hypothetical protein
LLEAHGLGNARQAATQDTASGADTN